MLELAVLYVGNLSSTQALIMDWRAWQSAFSTYRSDRQYQGIVPTQVRNHVAVSTS